MEDISVSDSKAKALAIIARVAETGEAVRVTKHGRPIVTVSPYMESSGPRLGLLEGTVISEGDIVSPIEPNEWDPHVRTLW